ncbi:MAG: DUF302 domain-containing protein [Actinobacteria bacterium]|nr:DUF302 domain-containing protein [Actinomycetota bacterium]
METSAALSFEIHVDVDFDEAIERLTAALSEEKFGILTRIDVHKTLKEKLDKDFRQYAILGVCNPPLAHKALEHEAQVGLMLPCNITVEADPAGGSIIRVLDPDALLQGFGLQDDPVMREVGAEARTRLRRVAESLESA